MMLRILSFLVGVIIVCMVCVTLANMLGLEPETTERQAFLVLSGLVGGIANGVLMAILFNR